MNVFWFLCVLENTLQKLYKLYYTSFALYFTLKGGGGASHPESLILFSGTNTTSCAKVSTRPPKPRVLLECHSVVFLSTVALCWKNWGLQHESSILVQQLRWFVFAVNGSHRLGQSEPMQPSVWCSVLRKSVSNQQPTFRKKVGLPSAVPEQEDE